MHIQRLFLALCATHGHWIHGADIQDACTHAKTSSPGVKTHMRADNAHVEWACKVPGKDIKRGSVMEVMHSLLSGEQLMDVMDKLLIDDLGFSTTTCD